MAPATFCPGRRGRDRGPGRSPVRTLFDINGLKVKNILSDRVESIFIDRRVQATYIRIHDPLVLASLMM